MLINLSNHPSSKWGTEQMHAALKYGNVVDWQFPLVEANASHRDIVILAKKINDEIVNKYGEKISAMHIMGEFTLCYALVSAFKKQRILCLASTTERISVDNVDGSKTSVFKFVQFREY